MPTPTPAFDSTPLTAVVTFGGTSEPLDDVRVLTNRSRGRFGAAIVRSLLAAGVEVTAIGSEPALAVLRGGGPLPPSCRLVSFATTDDLADRLREVEGAPPGLLFMAAAVSDYRPLRHTGKLRSDAERLVLELERTPKLLPTLRERLGAETFLVGFKLLSGVSREELVAVATRQAQGNHLDLTVANDLATFTERDHPVQLVTPDGAAQAVEGERGAVARRVVAFALERCAAPVGRTEATPEEAALEHVEPPAEARELLQLAQASGGAMGWSAGGHTWTTRDDPPELVTVEVDLEQGVVRSAGAQAPTSDSALFGWLLRELPVSGLLRAPGAVGVALASTRFPHPAGSLEEGQAILAALVESAHAGHDPARGFAVDLGEAGRLIGVPESGVNALQAAWSQARAAYASRRVELGAEPPAAVRPLWDGAQIAGAVGHGPGWVVPFVHPDDRGRGVGDRLADWLRRRGQSVAVHDGCDGGFYLRRGFRPAGRDGSRAVLEPPSLATPARVGASVCLVDVIGRRVLMGRRLREPWAGRTSFPGGGVEEGETALLAARRELREETSLRAPSRPWFERVVYAGDEQQVLRVHCFVVPCLRVVAPTPSDEFAGEWLSFAAARARQLTPSAGCILDEVERALGLGWREADHA